MIAIFIALLRNGARPSLPAALLAAVPPFLFLSVVANDLSRWTVLAALNVWLLCAVGAGEPAADAVGAVPRPWPWSALRIGAAMLVIPLVHPKTWPIEDPIFSPAPVIDRAAQEVGEAQNAALSRRPGALRRGLAQRARRLGGDAEALSRAPSAEASPRVRRRRAWVRLGAPAQDWPKE